MFLFSPNYQDNSIKEIIVINAPISEGKRFLDSLPQTSTIKTRSTSPRRQSPRRSASPKRPGSPKRKLSDEEMENESPRPTKRTATKLPFEELKPAKVCYLFEIVADLIVEFIWIWCQT